MSRRLLLYEQGLKVQPNAARMGLKVLPTVTARSLCSSNKGGPVPLHSEAVGGSPQMPAPVCLEDQANMGATQPDPHPPPSPAAGPCLFRMSPQEPASLWWTRRMTAR